MTESDSCHIPTKPYLEENTVFQKILSKIKEYDGLLIGLNACIESVYNQDEQVRRYIGDKAASRDNRKVRELCLKIVKHENIEVVKHRPQIIVRWKTESAQNKTNDDIESTAS